MTAPELRVVESWHEALNAGEAERVVGQSHPDVEVRGPRGSSHGARLLRELVGRASVQLTPLRFFQGDRTLIVEQEAEWRSAETGELSGSQLVASVFVACEGLVVSVVRHPDLAGSLCVADVDGVGGSRAGDGSAVRGLAGGEDGAP